MIFANTVEVFLGGPDANMLQLIRQTELAISIGVGERTLFNSSISLGSLKYNKPTQGLVWLQPVEGEQVSILLLSRRTSRKEHRS